MVSEQVLLITCSLLAACLAQPTRTRYCGSNLADALKLACGENGYNVPTWTTSEYQGDGGLKRKQHAYIRSLGVATECCYLGCSWRTLTSYCADPRTRKSRKSSGDEDQYDDFEKTDTPSLSPEDKIVKESDIVALTPEVGDFLGNHPGRMGKMARNGKKRRKSRNGRNRQQRRRGGRVPRCRCTSRNKRPKKVELENIQRSAPVFGTVSPEYMRLPRTLDELPPLYHGLQGY